MKFKKILIIFLCVALLAAFSVSCFATSQESYGFYISPGDYVFDEVILDDASIHFSYVLILDFRFTTLDGYLFDGISFTWPGYQNGQLVFNSSNSGSDLSVLRGSSWLEDSYRFITVLDGFYIYDINIYQWWQSNVTRVSPGYNSSFFDNMLSIFTAIGQWISGAAANLTSMFFVDNSLTFVGTLTIAALAMAVAFLIIGLISRFLRFKA